MILFSLTPDETLSYVTTSPPAATATLLVGSVAAFAAGTLMYAQHSKKKNDISVPYAPCTMLETMQGMGGNQAPIFFHELARQALKQPNAAWGCYRLNLPPVPGGGAAYVVYDYQLVRRIFQDSTTDKPPMYKTINAILGRSESIFTSSNNAHWTFARKSTRNAFSNREVSRMMHIAGDELRKWQDELGAASVVVDPAHEMARLVFRIIYQAGFEYTVTDEEFAQLEAHWELPLREFTMKQGVNPLRRMFQSFYKEAREAHQSCKVIQSFAYKLLQTYRNNQNKSKTSNTLIKLIVDNDGFENDEQRVAELVVYILAGHDTTAYSIANTLVLLAKNPTVQDKFRSELHEKGHACEYSKYVVKEGMRCMPVAATGSMRLLGRDFDVRNADEDSGTASRVLPKGSTVFLVQYATNHDGRIYPNPEAFEPDRWATATPAMKEAALPFALGSRNCVGQALAMAEINSVLPSLVAKYRIDLIDEGVPDNFLTLKYSGSKTRLTPVISS